MLKVLDAIQLSTEYLQKKGIESSRMNAEILLAEILGCKRLDLYLSFDRPLSLNEKDRYREFIARRGKFEPLQYIIGSVEFYGLNFSVNRNVLIPRPETEILVEKVIQDFNAERRTRILEIGTGSGNISIAIAKKLSYANLVSIDISEDAVNMAKENAELNNVINQIEFEVNDIFKISHEDFRGKFDAVVSNPPYVNSDDYKQLQKEIVSYEPKSAVTDSGNGYTFYNIIAEKSLPLLGSVGKVYFEVAEGQANDVKNILLKYGYKNIDSIKDYSSIERVVFGGKA